MTIEQITEAARNLLPTRPQLARVEIGSDVWDLLKEHVLADATPEVHPVGYVPPPESALMYGVPVVTSEGMDPRAWRLLDPDGQVIKEGTL